MKVTGVPLGVDCAAGVMLIPFSTAAVTVRLAPGAVMLPTEAVMVVLPTFSAVAMPVLLSIVATAVLPAAQVTWLVMLAVEASV